MQHKKQPLTILNQQGDYEQSLKILKENGLEPLTYQEALANSEFFIKEFKGEWKWFWLKGKDIDKKEGLYTFNKHGILMPLKGYEKPDKKVRVYQGSHQLSLVVFSVNYVALDDGRFYLYAYFEPSVVAPVVVGLPLGKQAKQKLTKLEIEKDCFRCPKCKAPLKLVVDD